MWDLFKNITGEKSIRMKVITDNQILDSTLQSTYEGLSSSHQDCGKKTNWDIRMGKHRKMLAKANVFTK